MIGNQYLGMVGLANRAGKLKIGTFLVKHALKEGKAHLIVMDKSLSQRQVSEFHRLCEFQEVPLIATHSDGELCKLLNRESAKIACVTDARLSEAIYSKFLKDGSFPEGTD